MDYLTLKGLHVAAVATSYALFALRGVWMIWRPRLLERRWVRLVPHLVDTVLLGSAVALAFLLRQYPFSSDWLTAKLLGLLVYIVLGTIALKRGRSRRTRIGAWIAAQGVFGYIVATAVTRSPAPWS